MKIVVANNFYYLRGGSERVLFEEKRILEENGHQVIPFSRAHPKNEYSDYTNYFPPIINYEFEKLSLPKKVHTAINIIYNRGAGRTFAKLLEQNQPDLVHAHNIYGRLTTSVLDAARQYGVPVVMTLYDYKLVCPSYLMLNDGKICYDCKGGKFYRCIVNRCHKDSLIASTIYCFESYFNKWLAKYSTVRYLICESQLMIKHLLESGFSKDRLVYIPNFIDTSNFEPRFDQQDYVLYVGRLSKEKGVLTLLKAVKALRIPVRIVGDGPERKQLEEYASQNCVKNVVFEGRVSDQELKELYKGSAFLVIPSECNENSPMVILEAFAYGKPVIGSRIGGIPELVESGQTGMLFEAGDANQLCECIEALWSNSSMISKLGQNARHKVESEFSPKSHYDKLITTYRDALM